MAKQWTHGERFAAEGSRDGTDVLLQDRAAEREDEDGTSQRDGAPQRRAKQDACARRGSALDLHSVRVPLSVRLQPVSQPAPGKTKETARSGGTSPCVNGDASVRIRRARSKLCLLCH